MHVKTLNSFRELVYRESGIKLDESKEALIRARIGKRMRALNISDHDEYYNYVTQDKSGKELIHLLDAISTNVTSFFRGPEHFNFLVKCIKDWLSDGQRNIKIWSAACSSGEEPYSIAMAILWEINEYLDVKILATDISTRVLEKAQAGIYESDKVDQVPNNYRVAYFEEFIENGKKVYRIKPIARDLVVFRRINLANPPFPMKGPFDAIFCRNVMIYFDNQTRHNLLEEIYRLLKPNGLLFVGHAESLIGLSKGFKVVRPSIYIKL